MERDKLKAVLELLQSITLVDGPFADYEDDRLNAIDDLTRMVYPGVEGEVVVEVEK